jgi:hypothetical protein
VPREKALKSLALIKACSAILAEIQPASVRAVCYRLFVQGRIPSMASKHVKRVGTQLKDAREMGAIPWEWIVDETREPERINAFRDPEEYVETVKRDYRRDRWLTQPHRVEVWSEKGTVRGTLAPVLEEYGVTFRVMHGYASATAVHEVAVETRGNPQPLIVLYVGDWDPSGLHMSEVDLKKRLMRYGQQRMRWGRAALTREQIATHQLPSFDADTKRGDSRYRWFREQYGARCWEVDALSPVELRADVERDIRALIDWEAWNHLGVIEAAECESLASILQNWRSISGQDPQ